MLVYYLRSGPRNSRVSPSTTISIYRYISDARTEWARSSAFPPSPSLPQNRILRQYPQEHRDDNCLGCYGRVRLHDIRSYAVQGTEPAAPGWYTPPHDPHSRWYVLALEKMRELIPWCSGSIYFGCGACLSTSCAWLMRRTKASWLSLTLPIF